MIIEPQQWEVCPSCRHRRLIRDYVYGCDQCGKEIDLNRQEDYLRATNFHATTEDPDDLIFCSWACFFTKLFTVKIDNFLKLPYLCADSTAEGLTIRDFWRAVREVMR